MTYDIILQECFNLVEQLKKRDSWAALENNEFKVGGVTNQGPWSNKDISIIERLYLPGDLGIVCILLFCLHLCPFAVMPSEQVWAGRSSGRWDSGGLEFGNGCRPWWEVLCQWRDQITDGRGSYGNFILSKFHFCLAVLHPVSLSLWEVCFVFVFCF